MAASCNLFDARSTLLITVALVLLTSLSSFSLAARRLPDHLSDETPLRAGISYHGGAVLRGDIPVSILWYGQFKPAQKAILVDFLLSLTSIPTNATPSAAQWWGTIDRSYLSNSNATANTTRVVLAGGQVADEHYSLGKSLTLADLSTLAAGLAVPKSNGSLVLVLTDAHVTVEGFCSARCGLHLHGSSNSDDTYAYAWVGNAERQCPGQCAWPFAEPAYGPQGQAPLAAPNGDVGVDGMVVTLATMVAGAVTNPMGDGYYEGVRDDALEACTACAGKFGSGAYPGYPGNVLVDETTGGSYNAVGANGRKYLLPAVYDPVTSDCSTLV